MTQLRILLLTFAMTLTAAGCGGPDDSGLDPGKRVTSLSTDERTSFCSWATTTEGGVGKTVKCDSEISTTVETVPQCVDDLAKLPATCTTTVDQAEACIKALAADPCNGAAKPACASLLACS